MNPRIVWVPSLEQLDLRGGIVLEQLNPTRRMNPSRPVSLGWSVGLGLGYAAVLSAIAALTLREPGSTVGGLGIGSVLTLYSSGGVLGGVVFWVLQVLRDSATGRAILGFACLLPLLATGMFAVPGDDLSPLARIVGAIVTSALVGGGIGLSVETPT